MQQKGEMESNELEDSLLKTPKYDFPEGQIIFISIFLKIESLWLKKKVRIGQ